MNTYLVTVYQLDQNDNRTDNILHEYEVIAKNRVEAGIKAGEHLKMTVKYQENKHSYYMRTSNLD